MREVFKDVKGYEGKYQVSNMGRVKSLGRPIKFKYRDSYRVRYSKDIILRQAIDKYGYMIVCLQKKPKKSIFKKVHRLVMATFVYIDNDMQVNHKDGVKTNNKIENLEYCTASQNQLHKYRVLKIVPIYGDKCHALKIKDCQLDSIKTMRRKGMKVVEIARKFKVEVGTIYKILKNKRHFQKRLLL